MKYQERLQAKRDRYIPKNYIKILLAGNVGGVVYANGDDLKPVVMGFSGNRSKPDFHIRFQTPGRCLDHVHNWVRKLQNHQQELAQRREERKAFQHTLKKGDILYSSWGYEQTNIEFWEVVSVSSRTVEIQQLSQNRKGFLQGETTPIPGEAIGSPKRVVVRQDNRLKVHDHADARPWHGQPIEWSSYN